MFLVHHLKIQPLAGTNPIAVIDALCHSKKNKVQGPLLHGHFTSTSMFSNVLRQLAFERLFSEPSGPFSAATESEPVGCSE
jgi:hypothetical protein